MCLCRDPPLAPVFSAGSFGRMGRRPACCSWQGDWSEQQALLAPCWLEPDLLGEEEGSYVGWTPGKPEGSCEPEILRGEKRVLLSLTNTFTELCTAGVASKEVIISKCSYPSACGLCCLVGWRQRFAPSERSFGQLRMESSHAGLDTDSAQHTVSPQWSPRPPVH